MPKFVWTAKDKSGKTVVRELAADTIEKSKAQLLAEGCTDLVLRGDEIADAVKGAFPDKLKIFGEEVEVTAEQRLWRRNRRRASYLRVVSDSVVQDKGLYLLLGLVGGVELYRGDQLVAAVMGVAMAGWLVFRLWLGLPGVYFAKLNKAKDWRRWTEVLELVSKLRLIQQRHVIKVSEFELTLSRAQALAGLGRLEDALDEFQCWENQPGSPSWLHKAQVAGIYDIAKHHDRALECTRNAIDQKPTPAVYLDLMHRLLRYKRDTAQARGALAEAEKGTLTDIAKPYHLFCRGLLAYLERDYTAARRELEASIELMERTRHQPFRDGAISVANAYLCCVLAKQGDVATAKKCFAQARDYLVAAGESELLEECNRALK